MADLNKEYSYKDFTYKDLTKTDPATWNDTEVIGSNFYQKVPKTVVFPAGIKGVTFTNCNLDNVVVPNGCTVKGGCHRWIARQKDGEDWILDESLVPVEPINKAIFTKLGLSTSTASIPTTEKTVSVTQEKYQQLEAQLQADIKALEDAATWR